MGGNVAVGEVGVGVGLRTLLVYQRKSRCISIRRVSLLIKGMGMGGAGHERSPMEANCGVRGRVRLRQKAPEGDQRCPWVHFSKSSPTQSTSLLTQSNPIHHNCEYFDPHLIQSCVHSICENIIRYVSKLDFICAVNAAC